MNSLFILIASKVAAEKRQIAFAAIALTLVPLAANAGVLDNRLIGAFCKIANYLFTIAMVVGIGAALWAAFQYMTAGGDTSKVSGAHKTLTYAAVGIAVALLAGSVPGLVASLLDTTVDIPTGCK